MQRILGCAAVVLVMCATRAGAEPRVEADIAIGYGHLTLRGSDRFEERDGSHVEPRINVNPFPGVDQLRIGFGLGLSGYSHELDDDVIITVDDGDETHIYRADQWESVSLIVPELQLSWRQPIVDNDRGVWFVEPGIGVGAVLANYAVYDEWGWYDDDDDDRDHDSEWDTTLGIRPFVRAGYHGHRWVFGGEVSYMIGGDVELTDQVSGDLRELFIGGFFGVRF
jgi:hypothetical protein